MPSRFALTAFLSYGPAFAQGLVVNPNCGAPGDTIRVRSGGWPKVFPALGYGSALNCAWGGQDTLLAHGSGLTAFVRVYLVPEWAEIGDGSFGLVQCTCLNADCSTCQSTTAQSRYVPFRVVANIDNAWQLTLKPCSDPNAPSCRPTLEMRFNPSLWCNTAACSKIRILQAYRDSGLCGTNCYRILTSADQALEDGASRDSTSVAGWTIDAHGWKPDVPADTDPYMNGIESRDYWYTGFTVGKQGDTPTTSFVWDKPATALPGEPPADVTKFVTTFETNAFCSDGPIQGEWLGRAVWQWSKQRGGPASITILSVSHNKPSQQFMDALRAWCSVRGFEWPRDDAIPTRGGNSTCTP